MSVLAVYISDDVGAKCDRRCRHAAGMDRLLQVAGTLGEIVVLHAVVGDHEPDCAETVYGCCASYPVTELLQLGLAEESLAFEQVAQAIIDYFSRGSLIEAIILEGNAVGTNIAACVGIGLGAGVVTQVHAINRQGEACKTVLGGSGTVEVQITSTPRIVTIASYASETQTSAKEISTAGKSFAPKIIPVAAPKIQEVVISCQREYEPENSRPALREARVVVAGGRGIGEDWSVVDKLVDAIGNKQGGAAIGATKAAVDLGWIGHEAQVGQTGVVVSPDLYISAGISGAQQQKSGMQTSRTVLAVNTDPDAPIFEIADFGIIGDARQVLSALATEIEKRVI